MPILQIRGENGNFIPINALNGKSAYEQAKEGGYTGTEGEFIAFLNGVLNESKVNDDGGYSNGQNATTTAGGAIGKNAQSTAGGAIGHYAETAHGGAAGASAKSTEGGAVGYRADAGNGGAVGYEASATGGGAVGMYASEEGGGGAVGGTASVTSGGGAVGASASATNGGAVGSMAKSSGGGAVGYTAEATSGGAVGFQAFTTNGGAVGEKAWSSYGGAVGWEASATEGGAIGVGAKTGKGFAGGKYAKTVRAGQTGDVEIDAIQLGQGTNSIEKTLQVYDYQLMDANGKVPSDRLPIATGSYDGSNTHGASNPLTLTFPFVPKLVFICPDKKTSDVPFAWIYGTTVGLTAYNNGVAYASNLTWEGTTLTWYTTDGYPSYQHNTGSTKYYWVAIG